MKQILLLILLLTACSNQMPNATSEMFIDFIDIGQGDATLIQEDDQAILIDCGPPNTNLIEFLNKYLNNKEIELLIITHADLDHIGGCQAVYDNFEIKETWEKQKKGKIKTFKDIKLELLSPDLDYGNKNDNSLVTLITFSNFQALVMGDCAEKCEKNINQEADVLRTGHHGSKTSTSKTFLLNTKPQLAIISVGNNTYGHPHQKVLNNLKSIPTLRTDLHKTITIKVEKNGIFGVL